MLAGVFPDVVGILETLDKGVHHAEALLTVGHFNLEVGTLVLLDFRSHSMLLEVVDDRGHGILEEQLAKQVPQVDGMAAQHTCVEAIQETILLKLIDIVELSAIAVPSQLEEFVFPALQ